MHVTRGFRDMRALLPACVGPPVARCSGPAVLNCSCMPVPLLSAFFRTSILQRPTQLAGRRTIRRPIVAAGDADANAALGLRATANALHLATTRGAAGATLGSTGPLRTGGAGVASSDQARQGRSTRRSTSRPARGSREPAAGRF